MRLAKQLIIIGGILLIGVDAPTNHEPEQVLGMLCTPFKVIMVARTRAYIDVQSIALSNHRASITFTYGVRGASSADTSLTDGVAFQLDQQSAVEVRSLSRATQPLTISFSGLRDGAHRIWVGFPESIGDKSITNSFCFDAPAHLQAKGDTIF